MNVLIVSVVHNGTAGHSDKHAMSHNVEHLWKALGARIDNVGVFLRL